MEAELSRTALRLASAGAIWFLMRATIASRQPDAQALKSWMLWLGLTVFLSIPVLIGNYRLGTGTATLFALSSLPVGIKEEIVFRGVPQQLLGQRMHGIKAIVVTSVVFVAWHVGVVSSVPWTFFEIFLASVLLGLIYYCSGSLVAVIAVHALYDALYALSPWLARPLALVWGPLLLLVAVGMVFFWATRMDRQGARQ